MDRALRRSVTRKLGASIGLALLAAAAPLGARGSTSPTEYEVVVAKNVMVLMRDEVRLATDVYQPARNGEAIPGRFPILLSRTSHGKNGSDAEARFLAQQGYAVVIQDVRGR